MKQDPSLVSNKKETFSPLHAVEHRGRLLPMHPEEDAYYTTLYNQYFPLVMQLIGVQSGADHSQAEDIAQDIFLIVWRRREKLLKIPPPELKFYLFVMVKNRLINEGKKATFRRRVWQQMLHDRPNDALTAHHELYERRAEWWLDAAVTALPERPRKAYILREQHGLKVKEIVQHMGISQAGTSRLLQEAERNIHAFLARQII